jgi:diguanylate cyclase (GGDEF)-like protein/PAS domain S-box-containing protein
MGEAKGLLAVASDGGLVFRALDELPDSSVMVFDTGLRYVLARGAALADGGFVPEALEGRLVEEVLAPARWAFYRPMYEAALRGEHTSREVTSPDGSRHFIVRVGPVVDGEGRILGGVALAADVTDQVSSGNDLRASEQRFRLAMFNAGVGTALADADGRYTEVNGALCRMLGYEREGLIGRTFVQISHPDDVPASVAAFHELQAGARDVYRTRKRYLTGDGGVAWSDITVSAIRDASGAFQGTITQMVDVTTEVTELRALSESEERFRVAVRNSGVAMSLSDGDGRILDMNETMCLLLGRTQSEVEQLTWRGVVHPDDARDDEALLAELLAGARETYRLTVRFVRSDGSVRVGDQTRSAVRSPDGSVRFLITQVVDVTVEAQFRDELEHKAFHDELTGLHNRAWILDSLDADVRTAQRSGVPVAVLFIDLDNFKVVNDSLGHSVGDEVLTVIATRIESGLRAGDRLGRFGGDEFIVVVPNTRDAAQIERVAERISRSVSIELTADGHRIVPSVSMGIAISGPDSTATSLLRDGDSALFRAKAAGRSTWRFFDEGMHVEAVRRLQLEDEIRRGLNAGEFVVYYQPIVTLADGRIVAHEALVRWRHPTRGLLEPAYFLPVAEASGLIIALGQEVLEQVCALLVANPLLTGPVSVNVSAVQLASSGWLEDFSQTLARHHVDPARIVVEVTETSVLSLTDAARSDLADLRQRAGGVHLDDFGTGYSSISVLRDLPITGIKLDASFVHDLDTAGPPAAALTAGLAGLVTGLRLVGIAEGIESTEQAQLLLDQGWIHGQGYLFGHPEPQPTG